MSQVNRAEETELLVRRELRSPRSAAIAGIIYSVLTLIIMILMSDIVSTSPADISSEWLEESSGPISLVLGLVPFAGIAFMWFTGVIRDRLGGREDKFFATLFLGSGIILVVLMLAWGATAGAVFGTLAVETSEPIDGGIYVYGFLLMNLIWGNYRLRIAGVYMTAIASLWTRTGNMPRWLAIVTYVLALGFLVAAERVSAARFIFPGWVFVVSIYVLVVNYRRTHDQEGRTGPSEDD